jgi:hypothetical protein
LQLYSENSTRLKKRVHAQLGDYRRGSIKPPVNAIIDPFLKAIEKTSGGTVIGVVGHKLALPVDPDGL